MTILPLLGRGAVAGAGGGVLAGGFGLLVAEPVIDRAVAMEPHRHAAEVFARDTQHLGLLVGMTASGVALGVLFSVVYAALWRGRADTDPWRHSLWLAGAGFLAVWLLPFLRYPANPPGAGDPATAETRTRLWVAAVAIGVVTVALAAAAARRIADRGGAEPVRQLTAVGIGLLGLSALFLLPGDPDPLAVPAGLLWNFRLLSAATMLLLWSGVGAGFGLLGGYAARRTAGTPVPTG